MECHQCGARTHLMSACPELNEWTFMNYPQEEAEVMMAAIASQHNGDQTNLDNEMEFCEINPDDTIID